MTFEVVNGPGIAPRSGRARHTIRIELELLAEPLVVSASVPAGPIGLADIVPLAQTLCDRVVNRTVRHLEALGRKPSCGRACSACCRYMIPISVPEAFRLRQDIASMPPPRRRQVEAHFGRNLSRIIQTWPAFTDSAERADDDGSLHGLARWYSQLNIVCPLLVDDCCELYGSRPIACREHFVTDSPAACASRDPSEGTAVEMPLNVSYALSMLASELEGTDPEAVLMPTSLCWAVDNEARDRRTWPGAVLAERLATIVSNLCRQGGEPGVSAA